MRLTRILPAIALLILPAMSAAQEEMMIPSIHCTIKGTITGATVNEISLHPYGAKSITVPVVNGEFAKDLYFEEPVSCDLSMSKGGADPVWRNLMFFIEHGEVTIEASFNESNQFSSSVKGGPLNTEYTRYLDTKDSLGRAAVIALREYESRNDIYTPKAQMLRGKMLQAKTAQALQDLNAQWIALGEADGLLTDEGKELHSNYIRLKKEYETFPSDFMASCESIVGYYLTFKAITNSEDPVPYLERCWYDYRKKYPRSPYTEYLEDEATYLTTVKAGRYIDITGPDSNNETVQLSTLIKGKVAIVTFWGSTNGYPRDKTKMLIPLYKKYADKGFTVVGIMNETSVEEGLKAIREDNCPWVNIINPEQIERIIRQYGNSEMFLIDETGAIVAIDPHMDDIVGYLGKKFR